MSDDDPLPFALRPALLTEEESAQILALMDAPSTLNVRTTPMTEITTEEFRAMIEKTSDDLRAQQRAILDALFRDIDTTLEQLLASQKSLALVDHLRFFAFSVMVALFILSRMH